MTTMTAIQNNDYRATIERLKRSKAEVDAQESEAGARLGRQWAMEFAAWYELVALFDLVKLTEADDLPEIVRASANEFLLGSANEPWFELLDTSKVFCRSFIDAAREVLCAVAKDVEGIS